MGPLTRSRASLSIIHTDGGVHELVNQENDSREPGEPDATVIDFSTHEKGGEYANINQYRIKHPPNSPLDYGLLQTTEKGVIRQNVPQYDLVSVDSFMKSTGYYNELFQLQ